jgi:hypothetical protein
VSDHRPPLALRVAIVIGLFALVIGVAARLLAG